MNGHPGGHVKGISRECPTGGRPWGFQNGDRHGGSSSAVTKGVRPREFLQQESPMVFHREVSQGGPQVGSNRSVSHGGTSGTSTRGPNGGAAGTSRWWGHPWGRPGYPQMWDTKGGPKSGPPMAIPQWWSPRGGPRGRVLQGW
jgi:hypothetical protein